MLAAAIELFSEKGYHNVSMHEIAQKAEFAIGTLYKFFKNKEDLYKALMLEQADKVPGTLTKALESRMTRLKNFEIMSAAKGDLFRADNRRGPSLFFRDPGSQLHRSGISYIREIRARYEQIPSNPCLHFRGRHRKETVQEDRRSLLFRPLPRMAWSTHFSSSGWKRRERHPSLEDPDIILNILFNGLVDTSGAARFNSNLHVNR